MTNWWHAQGRLLRRSLACWPGARSVSGRKYLPLRAINQSDKKNSGQFLKKSSRVLRVLRGTNFFHDSVPSQEAFIRSRDGHTCLALNWVPKCCKHQMQHRRYCHLFSHIVACVLATSTGAAQCSSGGQPIGANWIPRGISSDPADHSLQAFWINPADDDCIFNKQPQYWGYQYENGHCNSSTLLETYAPCVNSAKSQCGRCQECSATASPPGYAFFSGSTRCGYCLAGQHAAAIGEDNNLACSQCRAGRFQGSANIQWSCTECAAGKYSANDAATTCAWCSPGKSNSETGRSTCDDCIPG